MARPIRTRFAPSPTGFLHIGGARTALFNMYFAQANGGQTLLRIEDTDRERSTPEATQAILDGLDWLGVEFDETPVFQSQNIKAHTAAAHAMLATGKAFRCYATKDELDGLRDTSRGNNTALRSPYRDSTEKRDEPFTVRFRVPEGQTIIQDSVQGEVTWDNSAFDDLVLLRADGTPTYMLAVVVDDHDMGISHVIRGDDHLINAGRQTQLYEALGWDVPNWAHVPLIHGPDGKKLSKRHGALGVEAYRDMGYLPSALRNYLVKLGWAHGDEELFYSDTAITDVFTLNGLNSAPARLDFDKMDYVNAQHMAEMKNDDLFKAAKSFLNSAYGEDRVTALTDRLTAAMPSLKPRAKTLKDIAELASYLIAERPLEITGKAAKPLRRDGAVEALQALTSRLQSVKSPEWNAERLQTVLEETVEALGIGFGKVGQPVRAALTGGAPSPDLSEVLALLGRDETLGRLSDALDTLAE